MRCKITKLKDPCYVTFNPCSVYFAWIMGSPIELPPSLTHYRIPKNYLICRAASKEDAIEGVKAKLVNVLTRADIPEALENFLVLYDTSTMYCGEGVFAASLEYGLLTEAYSSSNQKTPIKPCLDFDLLTQNSPWLYKSVLLRARINLPL